MAELLSVVQRADVVPLVTLVRERIARPPIEYGSQEDAPSSFTPDVDELHAVINAVFWASLEQEEGKPVLPRVVIGDAGENDCNIKPCELSPAALRKLSPFLDNPALYLQCSKQLRITSIGSLNEMDVSVHAERPGMLVISHMQRVLAVLEEGQWVQVDRDVEALSEVLAGIFGEDDDSFRRRKAYALIMLASSAREAKRGAMFVMTPPHVHAGLGTRTFEVTSFNAGREALIEGGELDQSFEWVDDMWRYQQHRELVLFLRKRFAAITSAGAGVDGATLLDESDLRPVAFGVKIDAPASDETVQLLSFPGKPVSVHKKALGGMRHQSAARLVQYNNAATVVTVSQDGTISLFTWGHRQVCVLVVKHIDRFLRAARA